jgi:hypothetical protein
MRRLLTLPGFSMHGGQERGIGVWQAERSLLAQVFYGCISMLWESTIFNTPCVSFIAL